MSQEPQISGSVTIGFDEVLQAAQGSPSELYHSAGLDTRMLDDPFSEIPLRSFISLLENSAKRSKEPNIGMRYGEAYRFEDLGPIGYAVMHAPTVGKALRYFADTLVALQDDSELTFCVTDNIASMKYRVLDLSIWPRRQDAEFSISLFTGIIRNAVGPEWRPSAVHFEHSPPLMTEHHRRFFRAPVHFNMPINALFFPASQLDIPMPAADLDKMTRAIRQMGSKVRGRDHPLSFIDIVNRTTMMCLLEGNPCSRAVADKLGMSGRTFNRRLGVRGVTFRHIMGNVRSQMAQNLLSQQNVSITETAYLLGYSDPSAFNRAFKTWTGTSPTGYRFKCKKK